MGHCLIDKRRVDMAIFQSSESNGSSADPENLYVAFWIQSGFFKNNLRDGGCRAGQRSDSDLPAPQVLYLPHFRYCGHDIWRRIIERTYDNDIGAARNGAERIENAPESQIDAAAQQGLHGQSALGVNQLGIQSVRRKKSLLFRDPRHHA